MICEAVEGVPTDALANWEDKAGITYCIRKSPAVEDAPPQSANGLHHQAGTSAAVWNIGRVFIKVKAWRYGMQSESDTIRFVNDHTEIPTPVVIYSWVDLQDNHSQAHLAQKVAKYCKALSSATSNKLQTSDGKGVVEPFLTSRPHPNEPSWKPQFLGPYTAEELSAYLGGHSLVESASKFLYYHADLGPKNIMVDDREEIVAVLDWESAAFYPPFWLGTKPMESPGFRLSAGDRNAWAISLTAALEKEGFAQDREKFLLWKSSIGR
ncbi:hypothetical protein EJ07DRAFT_152058 [Lizonia empirigonia]|nr:hypothetical protein EJ07DRAFT_152058 [Lizonia empirigonia]